MWTAAELLLAYVALYPLCAAAFSVAGGLLFRLLDEQTSARMPGDGWPGVSVLIPAHNEEHVIATCITSVLAADYYELELLVLDDGSTDNTVATVIEACRGDSRCRVIGTVSPSTFGTSGYSCSSTTSST
jgi:biofilm PGA synthesis N-glycosyltransferase PgaC